MKLSDITPLILTYNEAPNIARTLAALAWAQQIVVVDSSSTDGTAEILKAHPRVRRLRRPFDTHAGQWSFGLQQCGTEWVLALDADYVLTPEITAELARLGDSADVQGYAANFKYCIGGRPLRGNLYRSTTVLFRRVGAEYIQDGHTQRVKLPGRIVRLKHAILHDDRKPLSRWLEAQARYTAQEAAKLSALPWRELGWPDRARRLGLGPLLVPVYCLVIKGLVLDGWRGWYYTLQRTLAEILLLLRMMGGKQDRGLS